MINPTDAMNSAVGTAKDAAKAVPVALGGAVTTARGTLLDTAKTVVEFVSFLRGIGANDIFGLVGLERRKSPLGSLAMFGGGLALGAGIGMLLAPVSGREARNFLIGQIGQLRGRAMNQADQVADKAEQIADRAQDKAGQLVDQVQDKAGQVVGQVQDKAGQIAGDVKERAGELVGQAQEKLGVADEGTDEGTDEQRKARRGRANHTHHIS